MSTEDADLQPPAPAGEQERVEPRRPGSTHRALGPVDDVVDAGRWERMWRPFWVLPSVICGAAVLLGILLPELDTRVAEHVPLLFEGGVDSARSVLGQIASAMISVTGLVFSITMVVLQLASSQFTPRLLGQFLSSRVVQVTLGIFTSSFVFSLLVLRSVRGGDEDEVVPQLAVSLAFVLVLASVGLFFAFIHHITTSIQVARVIDRVSRSTLQLLNLDDEEWDPETLEGLVTRTRWNPPPGTQPRVVHTGGAHGIVEGIRLGRLVELAARADALVELRCRPGQPRYVGDELAVVHCSDWDAAPDGLLGDIAAAVLLGEERTLNQDPEFGIRQLVDIGVRALSPGINDPTTAVQVLDELHRILRCLVERPDPSPLLLDGEGVVRVVDEPTTFLRALDLSLDEIVDYSSESAQVRRRVEALLRDLDLRSLLQHRPTVTRKLEDVLGRGDAATD